MKLIFKDKAYVQLNDLMRLCDSDIPVPLSIMRKITGTNGRVVNKDNRYNYLKFTSEDDIEYIKKQTWMIDYNEVKRKSEDELLNDLGEVAKEWEQAIIEYNKLTNEEQETRQDLIDKKELLSFKYYSLRDVLMYKRGDTELSFPTEKSLKNILFINHKCNVEE